MDEAFSNLYANYQRKDRRALARLLSLASRGESTKEMLSELNKLARNGRSIAFSGSGGVGKSTLIGRLVELIRKKGEPVAVLCCDPESPVTGGALLGDRVRIARAGEDPGLFVRSLATPTGSQAIAPHLDLMIKLLHGFGFNTVLIETVGAGQGDTAVQDIADELVVLVQPEAGDELQWEKAGLLEVADIVVVHKADLPGAERVAAQLGEQLNMPGFRSVPVLITSATKGQGLEELWQTITSRQPPAE